MKMTRRNFLSTSAVAALACGASLTAHAAGSTDENSLNFITDIFCVFCNIEGQMVFRKMYEAHQTRGLTGELPL